MRSLSSSASHGWVKTKNGNFSSISRSKAFQHFDSRGLARTIRAEQCEYLTGLNREIDPLDSLKISVFLGQTANLYGSCRTHRVTYLVKNSWRGKSCSQRLTFLRSRGPDTTLY